MGTIAARLDDLPKAAWIALTVLGFAIWWPLGLAALAFVIGSRKMGCWHHGRHRRWDNDDIRDAASRWFGGRGRESRSGNQAFDAYREETLRRLEEEQREFHDFLDRLRFAKDKAEFDEFLAARRNRPQERPPEGSTPQSA